MGGSGLIWKKRAQPWGSRDTRLPPSAEGATIQERVKLMVRETLLSLAGQLGISRPCHHSCATTCAQDSGMA